MVIYFIDVQKLIIHNVHNVNR